MADYEKIIRDEAEKWYPDCEDLLIWTWDEEVSGRCHPLSVVASWEDETEFPRQVARKGVDFLGNLLSEEWARSGRDDGEIPTFDAYADESGRVAWRMNLKDAAANVRVLVGLALLRDGMAPAWDFGWENLACPEDSKSSVISADDGRYVYEATEAELMGLIEEMRPEPESPSYLGLLIFDCEEPVETLFAEIWRHDEGTVFLVRLWEDAKKRVFRSWIGSMGIPGVRVRELRGRLFAESHFIPPSLVPALAMSLTANPHLLPERKGVFWEENTEAVHKYLDE